MSTVIGALRATLGLNDAEFQTGLTRAERRARASSSAIQKSLGGIKSAFAGLVAGISLAGLGVVAKNALDYASSLGEVSQQLGITTRDLQVFRYAATQTGVSQDEMDRGLQRLTKSIGDAAAGSKPLRAAFSAIGISVDDLKKKDTGQIFRAMADGLGKIKSSADRAAVETAIFGRAGQKLDTLLSGGSGAINELAQSAENLGIVLSDEQIQKADETADKLASLKQVLEARIAGVVADNADSILSLANAIAAAATAVVNFLNSNPQKALAIMGALGGGVIGGAPGAAGGAIAGLGIASLNSREGVEGRLRANSKNMRSYYLQNGGTEQELAAGRVNPAVMQKLMGKSGWADYLKQRNDLKAQLAAMSGSTVAALGGADGGAAAGGIPEFLDTSGGGRGGGRGKSAEQLEREAERVRKDALRDAYNAAQDQRRAEIDILQAQQDLAHDIKDRGVIAEQILAKEKEGDLAQIEFNLAMGDINETQAAKQREMVETLNGLRREKSIQDEAYDLKQEQIRQARAISDSSLEIMELEASLAETASERRAIELKILDARFRQLRQAEQDILDDERASFEQKNSAGRRLLDLDRLEGGARESVMRGTMGPMEEFLRSLPTTAAKANEALEAVAVNGLQSLTDGITEAIMGAKSLGEAFSDVAKSIIADLIKIAVQRAIVGPLANALFGGVTGSPAGFGGMFAEGGRPPLGKVSVVGEKGPELFVPDAAGTIIPNHALASGAAAMEGLNSTMAAMNIATANVGTAIVNGLIDQTGGGAAGAGAQRIELVISPSPEFTAQVNGKVNEMGVRVVGAIKPLALEAVRDARRRSMI